MIRVSDTTNSKCLTAVHASKSRMRVDMMYNRMKYNGKKKINCGNCERKRSMCRRCPRKKIMKNVVYLMTRGRHAAYGGWFDCRTTEKHNRPDRRRGAKRSADAVNCVSSRDLHG